METKQYDILPYNKDRKRKYLAMSAVKIFTMSIVFRFVQTSRLGLVDVLFCIIYLTFDFLFQLELWNLYHTQI